MLSTTLALFRSQALEDVSIDDIARAAGVGKATLYRYFETKEALVRACLDDVLTRLNERLEAAEAGPGPPPDRLRRIIGAMVDTFSDDLMPLRLITRRESDLRAEWRLSVHDARLRLVAVLGEHFRRGTAAGWYRELDGDLIAQFVMGMIRSGVTHVEGISRDALGDAIHAFVLRASAGGPPQTLRLSDAAPPTRMRGRLSGGADVDR
ncbi:MAG TPA: TetR/AcrR family transcriptional regulator [Geminicoccaceae bacterium]